MMVTVLLAPGGHRKVMQAFDYFRAIMKEKMRFQLLVASLKRQPVDPPYQAAVVCFINTVVQVAKGTNTKVFHQQEFLGAGFNPDEMEKVRGEIQSSVTFANGKNITKYIIIGFSSFVVPACEVR